MGRGGDGFVGANGWYLAQQTRPSITHVGPFDCLADQNTCQGAVDGGPSTPRYPGGQGPCAGRALQGAPCFAGPSTTISKTLWCLDQLEPAEASGRGPRRQTGPCGDLVLILPIRARAGMSGAPRAAFMSFVFDSNRRRHFGSEKLWLPFSVTSETDPVR